MLDCQKTGVVGENSTGESSRSRATVGVFFQCFNSPRGMLTIRIADSLSGILKDLGRKSGQEHKTARINMGLRQNLWVNWGLKAVFFGMGASPQTPEVYRIARVLSVSVKNFSGQAAAGMGYEAACSTAARAARVWQ